MSVGTRIRLARDARGRSQAELSKMTGLSPALLSRCESDDRKLLPRELTRVSEALSFPPGFFLSECRVAGSVGEVQFRRKSSMLAGERRGAVAELNLASLLAQEMLDACGEPGSRLELSAKRLRDYQDSPQFAAHAIRRDWQLPPGPVRNLTEVAEEAGVFVFSIDMGDDLMGLSHWPHNRPPVILLNSNMPGDRLRWTLAHEIGHLAMHTREAELDTMESEADMFASGLLMPRDDIYACLRSLTLRRLRELKREWGVAMQALIMRSHELGLMSSHERTEYFKLFSKRGWRKREPESFPAECTSLVPHVIEMTTRQWGSLTEFAKAISFPEDILRLLTSPRGHSIARRHLHLLADGDNPENDHLDPEGSQQA